MPEELNGPAPAPSPAPPETAPAVAPVAEDAPRSDQPPRTKTYEESIDYYTKAMSELFGVSEQGEETPEDAPAAEGEVVEAAPQETQDEVDGLDYDDAPTEWDDAPEVEQPVVEASKEPRPPARTLEEVKARIAEDLLSPDAETRARAHDAAHRIAVLEGRKAEEEPQDSAPAPMTRDDYVQSTAQQYLDSLYARRYQNASPVYEREDGEIVYDDNGQPKIARDEHGREIRNVAPLSDTDIEVALQYAENAALRLEIEQDRQRQAKEREELMRQQAESMAQARAQEAERNARAYFAKNVPEATFQKDGRRLVRADAWEQFNAISRGLFYDPRNKGMTPKECLDKALRIFKLNPGKGTVTNVAPQTQAPPPPSTPASAAMSPGTPQAKLPPALGNSVGPTVPPAPGTGQRGRPRLETFSDYANAFQRGEIPPALRD